MLERICIFYLRQVAEAGEISTKSWQGLDYRIQLLDCTTNRYSDTQFENPQVRKNCRKDMLSKRESEGTDGTVKPEAVDGPNSQDGSQPTQVSNKDYSSPSAPANTIEEDPAITRKREKLLADNSRLEAEIEKVIREQEELRAKLKFVRRNERNRI